MKINMNKKSITTLALAGVMIASPIVAFAADYKDVSSDFWAYKHIDKLTDEGIIKGFEDGKYYPLRSVSYLEVLKLLEGVISPSANETKEALEKYGEVADKYSVDDWAKEAVSISLAREIITEDNLKEAASKGLVTSKPRDNQFPSRQTVAVLYARALGLEPNKNHSVLKYEDMDKIGTVEDKKNGKVPVADYLSALVGAGIFNAKGNEGVFQPDRAIRRSEIAKITDLSYDYASQFKQVQGKIIYVTSIDGLKTIAFTDENGDTKTATIDSTTRISKDGKSISDKYLKKGQEIQLKGKKSTTNNNYKAINIEIINSELTATGKILAENNGKLSIGYTEEKVIDFSKVLKIERTEDFTLDKEVKIKSYDKDSSLKSIRPNDYIEFVAEDNVISEINIIPQTGSVIGTIEKLEADTKELWNNEAATLFIKLSDGKMYDFKVKDKKLIYSLLADNEKGKRREVILNYDTVTKVQDPVILAEDRGIIKSTYIKGDNGVIFIDNLNKSISYKLSNEIVIKESATEAMPLSASAAINEIASKYENAWVELKIKNDLVEEILVKNKNLRYFETIGTIKNIADGNPFVDIKDSPYLINVEFNKLTNGSTNVRFITSEFLSKEMELKLKGYYDSNKVLILYVNDKLVNVQQ